MCRWLQAVFRGEMGDTQAHELCRIANHLHLRVDLEQSNFFALQIICVRRDGIAFCVSIRMHPLLLGWKFHIKAKCSVSTGPARGNTVDGLPRASKFKDVKDEAARILPHLKGLIASEAQKKKKSRKDGHQSQATMMADTACGRPRAEVDRDARAVHAWLVQDQSALRKFLSAASDGGVFFTSNVHSKTAVAYVKHRMLTPEQPAPGVSADDFVKAAQGRLCD